MGKSSDWSITLTPHRSLSRSGYLLVMLVLAGTSFMTGLFFLALGAWPVTGFLGLDVLVVWIAFRSNFASASSAEQIVAKGDSLRLVRHESGGATSETRFNRHWVSVELEYDEARDLVGSLRLRSRGIAHEIAAFLGAEERQALARTLKSEI